MREFWSILDTAWGGAAQIVQAEADEDEEDEEVEEVKEGEEGQEGVMVNPPHSPTHDADSDAYADTQVEDLNDSQVPFLEEHGFITEESKVVEPTVLTDAAVDDPKETGLPADLDYPPEQYNPDIWDVSSKATPGTAEQCTG